MESRITWTPNCSECHDGLDGDSMYKARTSAKICALYQTIHALAAVAAAEGALHGPGAIQKVSNSYGWFAASVQTPAACKLLSSSHRKSTMYIGATIGHYQ